MYVVNSAGQPVGENVQTYVANGAPNVNPSYFKNNRGDFDTVKTKPAMAHTIKRVDLLHSKTSFYRFIPFDTPFKLHNELIEEIMKGHWLDNPSGPVEDTPIPGEPWSRPISIYGTQFDVAGRAILKETRMPSGWMSYGIENDRMAVYTKYSDGTYALKVLNSVGNVEDTYSVTSGVDFYFGAMTRNENVLYLAGNLEVTGYVTTAGYTYSFDQKFGKLSLSPAAGSYVFSQLADLPSRSNSMRLFTYNGTIYAIQAIDTESPKTVNIIKYVESENRWEIASRVETAERVVIKSVMVKSASVLFLFNGTTSKLYEYKPTLMENNIAEVVTFPSSNIRLSDNAGVLTALNLDTFKSPQPVVYTLNSDSTVEERTVTIAGYNFDILNTTITSYCLHDVAGLVQGGVAQNFRCTPFTHPWYKQYSIGSTVYSVAGKGNRLYVGTGSAIKVYDISDPNALVLKSTFTTNKTVYDLEVVDGDIMYAATSGGIYKLNTVNPDTLTSIQFYSTPYNYQYRIQLYNNLLYVGDDNGINIRDKNTFARLAYVNIGSTMDFAIANGELAMYWDDFWDSGIDIRDADTLTRKAWDYGYCSTGELTTDHGAFYLSCDGYEYRFVGLPNTYLDFFELDGDMREMQENYLYNGWVYIPDGNKVKLSTNNAVPSICGNGIIEPGEFCDGNTEDCAILDPNEWDSGTAYCNSTCTAWDTGDCYWSGC